jgi:hypothetical protein
MCAFAAATGFDHEIEMRKEEMLMANGQSGELLICSDYCSVSHIL